jgi:hypothetical protein
VSTPLFRQTEIEQLRHRPVRARSAEKEDVAWLEIAVNDVLSVHRLERLEDLRRDDDRVGDWQRTPRR